MAKIELDLGARIEAKLGEVADRQERLEQYLTDPHILLKSLVVSAPAITPANPVLLDFGAAPDGSLWDVDLVTFLFQDPWTVAANVTAAVFVGQPPLPGQIITVDCVIAGLAIPSTQSFGSRRPVVRAKKHLYAMVNGSGLATLNGTLYGIASASIVPDTEQAVTWL